MTLTTIIPFYNDLPALLTCLNSLHALQSHSLPQDSLSPSLLVGEGFRVRGNEFLVQDDASPAVDIRPLIAPNLASIERNPHNLGFAANCNTAAKRASGDQRKSLRDDILMFVNQDVYGVHNLSENWDSAILRAFEDETVGIAGARLLFPDGRVQSAGGLFDARGTPYHRCFLWRNRDYHEISTAQDVSWVTGAALAIRREIFERVGGFDTDYANGYFEDVDLCLKARELGYKIRYAPACTLVHRAGSTGGSPDFTRNALRFKRRWVDSGIVQPDSPAVMARYW
jgi:GT2 family glycosyltransferase